jgi:hypothetical protein
MVRTPAAADPAVLRQYSRATVLLNEIPLYVLLSLAAVQVFSQLACLND